MQPTNASINEPKFHLMPGYSLSHLRNLNAWPIVARSLSGPFTENAGHRRRAGPLTAAEQSAALSDAQPRSATRQLTIERSSRRRDPTCYGGRSGQKARYPLLPRCDSERPAYADARLSSGAGRRRTGTRTLASGVRIGRERARGSATPSRARSLNGGRAGSLLLARSRCVAMGGSRPAFVAARA
jgi:hypothetical protein